MSNRPDKRDQLLADLFLREPTNGLESFAKIAARSIRRRRALRSAAATVAICAVILFSYHATQNGRPPTVALGVPSGEQVPSTQSAHYEVISDEQLSNLLKTQPVLVTTDSNGRKRVILLSQNRSR